jgi:hypothetical protein
VLPVSPTLLSCAPLFLKVTDDPVGGPDEAVLTVATNVTSCPLFGDYRSVVVVACVFTFLHQNAGCGSTVCTVAAVLGCKSGRLLPTPCLLHTVLLVSFPW